MKRNEETLKHGPGQESGAALVTVLLITFLLVTASIAMLTAAGASARNSTDVLSETKAYYAAESGIQAAVNALRFGDAGGPVNYREAVNYFANAGTLGGTAWGLPYDTVCDNDSRVRIAGECDNSYKITVRDPDNSQTSLSFRTTGAAFRQVGTTTWSASRVFTGTDGLTTTLTWEPNTPNPSILSFNAETPSVATQVGSFKLSNGASGGTPITNDTEFRIFYELMLPGNPGWVISGKITTAGSISVLSSKYVVTGSEIQLCGNTQNCGQIQIPGAPSQELSTVMPAQIWPKEPHRLLVTSTGFGP
ncbi:MAG TPA: pilus assembly PilX N-terminal domain-containing protein, partial [Pyrinomonadaceae bacterium]|nr:pilus assembly PilX N-terminal domain-containing protein [Pyrinomonadaceae bacterium]